MEQTAKAPAMIVSDTEKLDLILKRLELLAQEVAAIKKEVQRTGAQFQPLIR